VSAFLDALRVALTCKKCGAANRPGAYLIDLDSDGLASCGQCGEAWRVSLLTPVRSQA
jgi:transcription elongation factor Elf1